MIFFKTISNLQEISAKVLQLMKSRDQSDLTGIANSVFDEVSHMFTNQMKYYVIGHSFGTLIALRLASMLEKLGKIGHVILIDGSPEYLLKLAQGVHKATKIHDNLEDDLLMILFLHFCGHDHSDTFATKLVEYKGLLPKIELMTEYVSSEFKANYSKKYLMYHIEAILNRLKIVMSLDVGDNKVADIVEHKLKSEITLIRPTQASFTKIADNYELQKYTEREVNVKYIDGNHLSVLENIDLANILNEITAEASDKS